MPREALTNANLQERAQPADGPHEMPLFVLDTKDEAEAFLEAYAEFRGLIGLGAVVDLKRDGLHIVSVAQDHRGAHALLVLFLRGRNAGIETGGRHALKALKDAANAPPGA